AVRTAPSGVTRSVFVSVANLDLEAAQRRLELRGGDGALIEVRDLLLDPQARADVVIDDVPSDVGTIELRLVGPDPAVETAADDLATDDRAWAVVRPDARKPILPIAPADDSDLGEVTGVLKNPGIGSLSPDEPVLRYVDLSTTHVAEATR